MATERLSERTAAAAGCAGSRDKTRGARTRRPRAVASPAATTPTGISSGRPLWFPCLLLCTRHHQGASALRGAVGCSGWDVLCVIRAMRLERPRLLLRTVRGRNHVPTLWPVERANPAVLEYSFHLACMWIARELRNDADVGRDDHSASAGGAPADPPLRHPSCHQGANHDLRLRRQLQLPVRPLRAAPTKQRSVTAPH